MPDSFRITSAEIPLAMPPTRHPESAWMTPSAAEPLMVAFGAVVANVTFHRAIKGSLTEEEY